MSEDNTNRVFIGFTSRSHAIQGIDVFGWWSQKEWALFGDQCKDVTSSTEIVHLWKAAKVRTEGRGGESALERIVPYISAEAIESIYSQHADDTTACASAVRKLVENARKEVEDA